VASAFITCSIFPGVGVLIALLRPGQPS